MISTPDILLSSVACCFACIRADCRCCVQYYNDLVAYMTNKGAGNDGQHNAINSWFWWCYPENASGTGGIVDSDWLTIDWTKVRVVSMLLAS